MARTNDESLPSLDDVLARINRAVDDFASRPAKTASDRGAFEDYPLHKVAIWGDVVAAEVLLNHGADINALGEDNDTPLHRAIAGESLEMIKLLLSRGADPSLPNRYGSTPRDAARMSGRREIISAFGSD